MANSVLHYVASDSDSRYPTWNNALGNVNPSSQNYTSALVAHNFYAYTDGYTVNSNGSQQGTGNGYLVKAIIKCQNPNTSTRRVAVGCAVYICRKDGYASNNTLTVKIEAKNAKQSSTYSKHFSTSSRWQKTAYLAVTLDYPANSGVLTETFTITGHNETGTCKSIENCAITVQLPNIGSSYQAASFTSNVKDVEIGKKIKFTISGRDPALFINLGLSYMGDDDVKRNIYFLRDQKLDEYEYTVPYSILSNVTKKKKAACTWYLTTYTVTSEGLRGTKVGATKSLTGNLIVPEDDDLVGFKVTNFYVKDTTGSGAESTNPSEETLLENYESGVSKPMLRLTIDDTKTYGATITSIEYAIGTSYKKFENVNLPSNKQHSYTADTPINGIGEIVATATITDSRGIAVVKSVKLNVVNASVPPDITALSVSRGTGDDVGSFTQDDEGEKVRVWFTAESSKIQEDGTGTMSAVIKYKEVGEEDFTQYPGYSQTTTDGVYTMEGETLLIGLEPDRNYVIRVEVSDPSVRYRETNLSSALYFIELAASGQGLSIGEKAEIDQTDLRINIPTKFSADVLNKTGSSQFTSDERKKNSIAPLIDTLGEEEIAKIYASVEPITYKYNDDKHETPLIRFGFSANKLKQVLEDIGLNTEDYSIIQEYEESEKDPKNPSNNIIRHFLSMSYEELNPINFLAIKLIMKELININNRLKEIEEYGKNGQNE